MKIIYINLIKYNIIIVIYIMISFSLFSCGAERQLTGKIIEADPDAAAKQYVVATDKYLSELETKVNQIKGKI